MAGRGPSVWQRIEVVFASLLLAGSLVGWPISALTWAKKEPPTVLGLSWISLDLGALAYLKTCRVHRDQDDSNG